MRRPLCSRSFRLLVFGQASSLFGSAILRLALAMQVLEATGSAAVFAGMLAAALVLIPTAVIVWGIGVKSGGFFRRLEEAEGDVGEGA